MKNAEPVTAEVIPAAPAEPKALALVPPPEEKKVEFPRPGEIGGYAGAGMTELTPEQCAALMEPFENDSYEIKPTKTGEVYVSQTHIRHRLNSVLGPGRWTIVPVPVGKGSAVYFKEGDPPSLVCLRARLYIHGNFISEAVGEQALANDRMTYATACEAAKSDALTRCAKDLSIGWECWDKRWIEAWKKENAILVQVKQKNETVFLWRRKDADPLKGEVKNETVAEAQGRASGTLISKAQESDLWALITETFPTRTAEATAKNILGTFGFKSFHEITADKYEALVKAIRKGA